VLDYLLSSLLIILVILAIILLIKLILVFSDVRFMTKTTRKHVKLLDEKVNGVYKALAKLRKSIIEKEGVFSIIKSIAAFFAKVRNIFKKDDDEEEQGESSEKSD
jgi:hypothetical protein